MPTFASALVGKTHGDTVTLTEGLTYTYTATDFSTLGGLTINLNGARLYRATNGYPGFVNFGDGLRMYGGRLFSRTPLGAYDTIDAGEDSKPQPNLSAYLHANVGINRNDYAECMIVNYGSGCRFHDLTFVGAAGLMLSADASGAKATSNRVERVTFDKYCFGIFAHDQNDCLIKDIQGIGAIQPAAWSAAGAYGHLVYFNYSALYAATADALSLRPLVANITERRAYAAAVVDHYCTVKMRMCEDMRVGNIRTTDVPGFGDFIGSNGSVFNVIQVGGTGNSPFCCFRVTGEAEGNGGRDGGNITFTDIKADSAQGTDANPLLFARYRLERPGARFARVACTGGNAPITAASGFPDNSPVIVDAGVPAPE